LTWVFRVIDLATMAEVETGAAARDRGAVLRA
jgi:hypothetical protein